MFEDSDVKSVESDAFTAGGFEAWGTAPARADDTVRLHAARSMNPQQGSNSTHFGSGCIQVIDGSHSTNE